MNATHSLLLPVALVGLGAALFTARADEDKAAKPPSPQDNVKRIQGVLEELRKKKFKQDVTVETQTAEDFRKFVDHELDKELPVEKAADVSKALQALDLLPKN